MLLPALYDMEEKNILPENMNIIGNARNPMSPQQFRDFIKEALTIDNRHHQHPIKEEVFEKLMDKISYIDGHSDDSSFYPKLKIRLEEAAKKDSDKVFYMATYPKLYPDILKNLEAIGLNSGRTWLVIEKPFGNDLQSAKKLDALLHQYFSEEQIYRIDHYLGKETVQNILTFRKANNIFEPLLNKRYIDHIQILASEAFGVGKRGEYYDQVGALRDFAQNHILQMLAIATMETPRDFTNQEITQKKLEILKNLVPKESVFGQYKSYKQEEKVNSDSKTDTFYAFKTYIENERFRGVPIYVRGGKKMALTATEIAIVFKKTASQNLPNVLIYRIQPNEGIVLEILTKKPGSIIEFEETYMQFCYNRTLHDSGNHPDPYERLISDVIRGDQTFFISSSEVEAQWEFTDKLSGEKDQVFEYADESWGPKEADQIIEDDGRKWLEPSMLFCRF